MLAKSIHTCRIRRGFGEALPRAVRKSAHEARNGESSWSGPYSRRSRAPANLEAIENVCPSRPADPINGRKEMRCRREKPEKAGPTLLRERFAPDHSQPRRR